MDQIKTRISGKTKGKYYAIKGMDVCYVCCAVGNDYKEVIKELQDLAKECDAYGLDSDIAAGLDKIQGEVIKYESYKMGKF